MRTATPVRVVGTAIALSLGLGAAAHASEPLGEITSIKGSALISQGAQYVPARAGMSLRELDRVVIMEDSSATVAFADGCDYVMGEMDLLTVSPKSPCQSSGSGAAESDVLSKATTMVAPSQSVEQAAVGQLGAGAAAGGIAGASTGVVILGGLAAAGFIYAATDDEPDRDPRRNLSPQ
jgi:hypothetical protein